MRLRPIAVTLAALLAATLGAVVVDAEPAEAATSRIAGASRYSTAVQVSRANPWPLGGTLYLASGTSYADALAAAPVAAAEHARLLLTPPDRVPPGVLAEIERIGPSRIVLVGGPAALSTGLEAQVSGLVDRVTRIGGRSRIETALLLMDRLLQRTSPDVVWVANASGFPDALVAGAVAARHGHALVLTHGPTNAFLDGVEERFDGASFVIAGGPSSVSQQTEAALDEIGSVDRIAGGSRYQTAVLINRAFTTTATGREMLIASGATFPDGLTASVLAGALGVPLYLVPPRCLQTPGVTNDVARLGITTVRVIGGTSAVSADSAALRLCSELQPDPPDGPSDSIRQGLLAEINAARAAAGVAPLRWDDRLGSMAQSWTATMASRGSATHSPTFCDRTLGWGYSRCGENIAWTSSSNPAAPMQFWMGSASHRANLLNPAFTHVGVGAVQSANGYWYWTQDFAG